MKMPDLADLPTFTVEEEHEILTFYDGRMLSLPHFQFKSINISTILTSKLKMLKYKKYGTF